MMPGRAQGDKIQGQIAPFLFFQGDKTMEYSPLQAVDYSVGRLLVDIYEKQRKDHGTANWQAFLRRENKSKILRGDFETASDILKLMEGAEKHAVQGGKQRTNQVAVPLIVYGRKPQIAVSDPEAAAYIMDMPVTDNEGRDIRLSAALLNIEYRVAMLAWDRPTLETMQLAWVFHVGKAGRNHRLTYDMRVGDGLITISGELIDPWTPAFDDASLTRDEGRLHAVILTATVKAYAIMGEGNLVIPSRFQWMLSSPLDSWFGPGSSWGIGGNPFDPDDPANEPGTGGTGGMCNGLSCWPNKI